MMRRRACLAWPLLLGACSVLPERPYQTTQDWPLLVPPPPSRPAAGAPVLPLRPVLLLRPVRAAAGLEGRGLRTLMPNGSLFTDPYQEWAAPPADAINDQLRLWLAASGLFSAVILPGSRLAAAYVLEAELTALWTVQATGQAAAALTYVLIDQRNGGSNLVHQDQVTGTAAVANDQPASRAAAACAALADAFTHLSSQLATALHR